MSNLNFCTSNFLEFDANAFKRQTRKDFEYFEGLCKFKIVTEKTSEYKESYKKVLELILDTLKLPKTFDVGNQFYIQMLINSHFVFLSHMSSRMMFLHDSNLIRIGQDGIIEKNHTLLKCLEENLKNPITLEYLKKELQKNESNFKS